MTRKYPLEPLQRVRDQRADERARALAEALRAVEASAELARRRAREQEARELAHAQVEGAERALLESGQLTAADLAQQGAWGEASRAEVAALARRSDEAARALGAARAQADAGRQQLHVAQAEAQVIVKHREGFEAAQQRALLALDEETADEAHLARRAREQKP